jgi:hypothetical protein
MLNEKEDWDEISRTPGLSEEFIRENSDKLDWYCIPIYQILSEQFIIENSNLIDWFLIARYQKLSEEFIRKNIDKLKLDRISKFQKLSEEFIRDNSEKIDWYNISISQKLSEKFIKEFSDLVDWMTISAYQKLSEGFIRDNSNKVHWYRIARYQKLSPEFIKEYDLTIPKNCWLYKDKEFKREYIKDNTEYEIIGDKVIAYKSCRSDGYSAYNFQYHYEVGGEYESNANYNIDENNSFGLSAWTKENALSHYPDGKLFKVEIDLEDIAAIVYEGYKIRASKIKILEEISI